MKSVIVIGAGHAAAAASRTLRNHGFDGRVLLVGAEPHLPYRRPPLSKGYLRGVTPVEDLWLLTDKWCTENHVEVRLGSPVQAVHARRRAVELADGTTLRADALLVATGGRSRRLAGVEGERVRYLRTLGDADQLRGDLRPGSHVVVIGAGFIGSEVASTASELGAHVTVLEKADWPLGHVLGGRMGEVCAALQRAHGIDLQTGQTVEKYRETASGATITTGDRRVIGADIVVAAIGMTPNIEPLAGAGIRLDGGVVVDEYCETNLGGIFAAGDVARHYHPLYDEHLRVEHAANASGQGAAAASNLLGRRTAHADPPWFRSDQFGQDLQYVGHGRGCDQLVVRGSMQELDFIAFYLKNGFLRAAFAIKRGDDIAVARQLIAARAMPSPRALADEDINLTLLAA